MADYIIEPLDTDADVIFQNFVEFVRNYFPDWEPSEGQLDVIIARYFSMQTAFTADMASRVQRAIYRYFGANLANIPPQQGSSAQVLVHFDVDDPVTPPVDRLLPFGTLVGLTDVDGDTQIFATLEEVEVTAGTTSFEVEAQAVELGAIGNNITGTAELVDLVDWISTLYAIGFSSGGSDPEQDDVYIQRLTENLALMAPRPLLPQDFAVYAQNVPGVWRAAVIDNFNPGLNEVQSLASDFAAGTGTFKLIWLGQETINIPAGATATQIRDALYDLPNIEITDIVVTGGPLAAATVYVEFQGKYGYTNVSTLLVDTDGLTGAGTFFTIAQVQAGTAYANDQANSIAISAIDEEGNPLPPSVKTQLIDYLEASRAQNFLIEFVEPAYYTVDITYTARALRLQAPDSVKTDIESRFTDYLSPANWGRYPQQSESRTWVLQPNVRYLELTTILENTPGVDYTESLTFSLNGSPFTSADKTFSGPFALTRPGTMTGTVNLPI